MEIVADKKKTAKELMEKLMKEESRLVKGRFVFNQVPGGEVTLSFKKWPNEEIKEWTFIDGQVYTIPLSLARHLQENCSEKVHQFAVDPETGKSVPIVGQNRKRMNFIPLEF